MKNLILRISKDAGISDIGFCGAEVYKEKSKHLLNGVFSAHNNMPEWVRTIIVCAFSYYNTSPGGNISRYAMGRDYHIVAPELMKPIEEALKTAGYTAESYVDTGALNERLLASLAGIAFRGRNQMAISDKLGSYFFIGYILTDCCLEFDMPDTRVCMNCGRCIKACPSGALDEDGFDENKCLSYITQKKGELSQREAQLIKKSGMIWGCDACQVVCPHNQGLEPTKIGAFRNNLIENLYIDENISNKGLKEEFPQRAFTWRGKSVLLRNQKYLKK